MKKILSFLLALMLSISSLSLLVVADWIESEDVTIGDFRLSIYRDGTVSITEYYGYDSDLIIPEKLGEYTVTKISGGAFDGCTFINNISIPDTIMEIGAGAFCDTGYYNNDDNWENDALYIGKHLVSAKEDISELVIKDGTNFVAEGLMEYNHNLTAVVFPSSIKFIGASAFTHCSNIKTIVISGKVENIKKQTFSNCTNLKSVVLNEGLKKIDGYSFVDCDDLRSIYLPSSIEFVDEDAFYGCTKFTDVYYGGTEEEWNTKVVTHLEGQFDFEGKTVHFNHIHNDENRNDICDVCMNDGVWHEHFYTADKTVPSTCENEGYIIYVCSCNKTYKEYTPATGHFYDENGVCEKCGDVDNSTPTTPELPGNPSDDCSCNCHKSGFMGFIWKILRIFFKLFKVQPVCSCGIAHY